MSQNDTEQQLRIWKDLAISKQMLMNEAATALKLKDDFSAEDLKAALDTAIKRARDADADMASTREQATAQINDSLEQVKKTNKARTEAETQRDDALKAQQLAEQQLANGRRDNAEALKKVKRQVEDKQKELKAINLALADTPENIVKKLKALKKQKLDEATGRKQAEDSNRVLKKDNKAQKEELEQLKSLSESSGALLLAYRELREWADSAKKASSDDLADIPTIDASILADIESATTNEEEEQTREAATA